MLRNLTLLVMLAGIISVESVNAAVQPPANNAPTPGQVQSTLPVNPSPTLPKSSAPVIVPPPTTANVAPGGPVFQVSKFVIEGNTAFPDSALQSQIAAYTNRDLTLADLYKAADKLTRFYQAHGYGVARATVPEQKITNGSVKLEVVEGKIGKFNVTGNVRTRTAVILRRTDSIAPGKLYTDAGMNRAILLINDLPGLQAQAVLEPGTAFGTVDVDLKTVETPVDGFVSIDNYGRDSIGRWRLNAGTDINSLTGSGDRLSAYVTHSSGNYLNFGALTYSLPLVPAGATLTTSYNRSEYHVAGHDFAALQPRGNSSDAAMNYLYPTVRSQNDNLFWGFGGSYEGSESFTKQGGAEPVAHTSLNVLDLSIYYNHLYTDGGYYTLSGQFFTNGESYDSNHLNAERARLNLDGSRLWPLAVQWSLIGKLSGQWSPQPLVDTDKFSLGGPDNVRGFLSAEARGDSGVFGSLEIQRRVSAGSLPLAVGGYLDSGKIWDKASLSGSGAAHTLTSVGLELSLLPATADNEGWNARLEWAYAVGGYRPSDGNSGGHIWFTLGRNF